MPCKLAVPFNIVEYSGGLAGLDAYFWDNVEQEQRRMLMILPISALTDTPMGLILEPRVAVEKQIEDVRSIAEGRVRRKRSSGLRLFSLRLASLFVPGKHILEELNRELDVTEIFSYRLAQNIARRLVDAIPTNRRAYLDIEANIGLRGVRLKTSFEPASRIYSHLLETDKAFKNALIGALRSRCRGD
ncbi:MAG: hypothetical protein ABWW69_00665 [Pyrodictiaceae archaeon]